MRLAMLALALVAALGATGCQRRSRYQPVPADSTAVAPDSLAAAFDAAQESWEQGAGEPAARASAAALLADLGQRDPGGWSDRARALLDSLAIGGEVGASGGTLLVNFFSRSEPDKGSWPFLYWSSPKGPRMQALEGRDLAFSALGTQPESGTPAAVAVLFSRRAAAGGQPLVMAWKSGPGGAWSLQQTLSPDSLGGFGTGEFVRADTTLELQTRTYRPARLFAECATCPHVYAIHRFRWGPGGFKRVADVQVHSPYSTVVRFVQAVTANDRDAAREEVLDDGLWDRARDLGWHESRGVWRAAPTSDETAHDMVFFRGTKEAYRVIFEARGDAWKIADIEVTTPSVE